MRKITSIVAAVALASTVAISAPANAAGQTITGDGSSVLGGRIAACAATYTTDTVTYTPNGSGSGRKSFNGVNAVQTDFAGSDVTYAATSDKAPADKTFEYVPLAGGPIAIAYNVSGVNNLRLTAPVLGKIFTGEITKWNDPAIAKLNKTAKLPNKTITVGYRAKGSGTFQNLVQYLIANGAKGLKDADLLENAVTTMPPSKFSAANSTDMATKIDQTGYSIGFTDLYETYDKDLQYASLLNFYYATVKGKKVLKSEYVAPSAKSSGLFLNAQTSTMATDGSIKINFTSKVKGAYPASMFSYAIVPTGTSGGAKGAAVKSFVDYVLNTCKATPGYAIFPAAFKKTITTKLIAKIG